MEQEHFSAEEIERALELNKQIQMRKALSARHESPAASQSHPEVQMFTAMIDKKNTFNQGADRQKKPLTQAEATLLANKVRAIS